MTNKIIVTDEEIVSEASKDSTYCQLSVDMGHWGAERQLTNIKEWAIAQRKYWQQKREWQKQEKPNDVAGISNLGGKIKAFQQVIDKCNI